MSEIEDPTHSRLLGQLVALSRAHLLYFRVNVGLAIRRELADVDASLLAFTQANAERLSEIGLDYRELRRAVVAHDVMAALPTELADRLQVSHLPEWARLPGPTERKMIASALVDNAWTVRELRDAVTQVLRGEWPDADPSEDGLQPAPPAPTAKRVVTGVVARAAREGPREPDRAAGGQAEAGVRHDRSTSQRRARVARRRDGRRDRRGLTASGSDPCPTSEHAQHAWVARARHRSAGASAVLCLLSVCGEPGRGPWPINQLRRPLGPESRRLAT